MTTLTLENIPPSVSEGLAEEMSKRGKSLNETVLEILSQSLGISSAERGAETRTTNGLERYAGRWSEEEFRKFEEAVASFEEVDEELWDQTVKPDPQLAG